MPIFESRTDLHGSIDEIFGFLTRPANLQAIAPPEMQLVFVSAPEIIVLGSRLTCKAKAHGTIQELTYEIVELNSPSHFREKMVDGPLKLWLHDYIFERDTAGEQVILINRIEFEPPGGLLGYIVTEEAIRDKLDDSFEHQRDVLQKKFAKPKI